MKPLETVDVELLLDLEADGAPLTPRESEALAELAADRPELADQRRELTRLHAAIARSRVEVRPDFRGAVLSALGPAGWEARHSRGWRFPLAALLALGTLAVTLLSRSAAEGGAALGLFGVLRDFVVAVAVAGGGLATASWRGLNLTLLDLVGSSTGTQVAFVLLALAANLGVVLLIRQVRRHSRATAAARGRR